MPLFLELSLRPAVPRAAGRVAPTSLRGNSTISSSPSAGRPSPSTTRPAAPPPDAVPPRTPRPGTS
eukprot:scaffold4913_cov111-Isochrysis_galbana.AAC.1